MTEKRTDPLSFGVKDACFVKKLEHLAKMRAHLAKKEKKVVKYDSVLGAI